MLKVKVIIKFLIEKNYPEIKLEKFDICIANANILKKN